MTTVPSVTVRASSGGDAATASAVKALLMAGRAAEARELFGEIVERHQRRAIRIAYHYLREAAETDEAVQDAFVKAFMHLTSFRDELPFEVWFTRIVVNGCLDRLKARTRRDRWIAPMRGSPTCDGDASERYPSAGPSPEALLLRRERQARVRAAIDRLPARQRAVVLLSQIEGYTTREVGAITKLNESTVRVHLFRAIRTLRKLLRNEAWLYEGARSAEARQ